MIKNQLLIAIVFCSGYCLSLPLLACSEPIEGRSFLHSELVGTVVFERYAADQLLVTARVDKRLLTHILGKEGDCQPQEMIRTCGHEYLTNHFQITINDRAQDWIQDHLDISKHAVTYSYIVQVDDLDIEAIQITSDFGLAYNDHGALRVVFDLSDEVLSYTLKNSRQTIIAKF